MSRNCDATVRVLTVLLSVCQKSYRTENKSLQVPTAALARGRAAICRHALLLAVQLHRKDRCHWNVCQYFNICIIAAFYMLNKYLQLWKKPGVTSHSVTLCVFQVWLQSFITNSDLPPSGRHWNDKQWFYGDLTKEFIYRTVVNTLQFKWSVHTIWIRVLGTQQQTNTSQVFSFI